jgi:hypothetical protein
MKLNTGKVDPQALFGPCRWVLALVGPTTDAGNTPRVLYYVELGDVSPGDAVVIPMLEIT